MKRQILGELWCILVLDIITLIFYYRDALSKRKNSKRSLRHEFDYALGPP